jgi:arabinofuranosyltransferase
MPHSRRLQTLLGVLAVATAFGAVWWHLHFLCDDAYIAFRYVSNAMLGRGLVWNPAPFAPVEGYSCFSWVLLLWGAQAVLGVEPPTASLGLGALCGLGLLLLTWRLLVRIGAGGAVTLVTLLGLSTHKVFVTWTSSGLETPLFNLVALAWAVAALARPSPARDGTVAAMATAAALTRPDGLLFVAATVLLLAWQGIALRIRYGAVRLATVGGAAVVFSTHLLWRVATYGEWVPNTYFAKVGEPWPEAGARFVAAFAVENGIWLWLLGAVAWLAWCATHRGWAKDGADPSGAIGRIGPFVVRHLGVFAVLGAVVAHGGYYAYKVGGDHFGFRVFSWWLPLLFVGAARFVRPLPRAGAVAVLAAWVALGTHPIGWMHHVAAAEGRATAPADRYGFEPREDRAVVVAERFVWPLSAALGAYDRWNAWLEMHLVALRRHRHVAFLATLEQRYPSRADGALVAWENDRGDRPVHAVDTVGIPGWTLPNVAILDTLGLNDRVVARAVPPADSAGAGPLAAEADVRRSFALVDADADGRVRRDELDAVLKTLVGDDSRGGLFSWASNGFVAYDADRDGGLDVDELVAWFARTSARFNAHSRRPPAGYIEAFRPNVAVRDGEVLVRERDEPLRDEEIRAIEQRFEQR